MRNGDASWAAPSIKRIKNEKSIASRGTPRSPKTFRDRSSARSRAGEGAAVDRTGTFRINAGSDTGKALRTSASCKFAFKFYSAEGMREIVRVLKCYRST